MASESPGEQAGAAERRPLLPATTPARPPGPAFTSPLTSVRQALGNFTHMLNPELGRTHRDRLRGILINAIRLHGSH